MPLDINHVSTLPFLVGEVKFMSGTQTPAGFVKANGQLLQRSQYPLLWAYAQASGLLTATDAAWVDGQYSPGDGTTTFRIPDYRGRFIRALSDGRIQDSGRSPGSVQPAYAGSFYVNVGQDDGDSQGGSLRSMYSMDINGQVIINNGAGGGTVTVTPGDSRPENIALPVFIYAGA